jgi:nucleoid DNA-binding protein
LGRARSSDDQAGHGQGYSVAAELSQRRAEDAVEAILATLKHSLAEGERIELRGLGSFSVRPRKHGVGRNPKTGEAVAIPPGRAVRFKAGKALVCLLE